MSFRVNQLCVLALLSVGAACGESEDTNQPPSVLGQSLTMVEDTELTIDGLARAFDLEGDALTVALKDAAGHTATVSGRRYLHVTPKRDFTGTFVVTYVVSDGRASATGSANVTVTPVNDTPVAMDATQRITATGSSPIELPATDADGDALIYEIVDWPSRGTLDGQGAKRTYTPFAGFVGEDVIRFRVSDGFMSSATATLRLLVNSSSSPLAFGGEALTSEDVPITIELFASGGRGPLTYAIIQQPDGGTISGTGPSVVYTPRRDYNGFDSLQFSVSDGTEISQATVSIQVVAVNDAPVAQDQALATSEDTKLTIALTATDVDGFVASFNPGAPEHGTLSGFGENLTYTPNANFHGSDRFTFTARDDNFGTSVPAAITIEVASVDDPLLATPIARTLAEDASVQIALVGTDGDGDAITGYAFSAPSHGTLSGTPPALTYTPNLNYNGTDSFTYTASTAADTSAAATVSLTISAVNDTPVATAGAVTTLEDTAIDIPLQATDVETQVLTYSIVTAPSDGTLSLTGAVRRYTPAPNATGTRSFTFRASDGTASATATIAIDITPVNDAPTAVDDFVITEPGEPVAVDVLANDLDVDGDAFELAAGPLVDPAHGTVAVVDGEIVYTPAAGFLGSEDFHYTVVDSQGAVATGTAHVGVGTFPPGAPAQRLLTLGGPTSDIRRVPATSNDGRFIAFASGLALVADDTNGVQDVYVYDRGTGALVRASVSTTGAEANALSVRPDVSANGRYVVFESFATNLVPGDTNGRYDVFRHDRVTGETVRISVSSSGGEGSGHSLDAEISDDGNLVAFSSAAFDLVANDANGAQDVFVRDIAAGTTRRLSVNPAGNDGDLASTEPTISGDGRFVAFTSLATNLVPGDTNRVGDVFVRELATNETRRISVATSGDQADQRSYTASISRDGQFISFVSDASNLVPGVQGSNTIYVRDTIAPTTIWSGIIEPGDFAQLSGDGRFMVIATLFAGVVVRDRRSATTVTPASVASGFWPTISGDGHYVFAAVSTGGIGLLVAPL